MELASIADERSVEASDNVFVTLLTAGERMNIQDVRLEPGGGNIEEPHDHPNEQIVFVYEGTITYRVGDEVADLTAGNALLIPGDIPHDAENQTDETAAMVEIFSPARENPPWED